MNVCDDCSSEDIEYSDRDDTNHYCSDCFLELDPEFIKFNGIKKISDHIKDQIEKMKKNV